MNEIPSLISNEFKIVKIDKGNLNFNDGLTSCSAVVSGELTQYQLEQLQDIGSLQEEFIKNYLEWCGRSNLGITGRPFVPDKIGVTGLNVEISGHFVSYLGHSSALNALNEHDEVGRLLVNTKRFQITNPTIIDTIMRQNFEQAFRVQSGSRIVKLSEVKDEEGNFLFNDDHSYGIEIPLIQASVKWHDKLISNEKFLREAISQGRNSIGKLINWQSIGDEDIIVNPKSFFLGGIMLNLNGVGAIIQEYLNKKGFIHINARFIDGGRSGGKLNEIILPNKNIAFNNIKFVELYNGSNEEIYIKNGRLYLKLGNPYPDAREIPGMIRKIDTSAYVGLYGSLSTNIVKNVMSELGTEKNNYKAFCIIVKNGKIYKVPWENSLQFQCNSLEYNLNEEEINNINGLSNVANHLRLRFGNEWESKIAFFKFIPPAEIIESLKKIGIRQLIVDDMQIVENAFNPENVINNGHLNIHGAISNSNLLNIHNNSESGAIKLYRIRDGILEEFKHSVWGSQSSFERLEKARFGICIYGGGGNDPEKAKRRFIKLFEILNKMFPSQVYIVQGRGPGTMQGSNDAAVETGILSIGVGSNLSPEQRTSQRPHLELVLEGANRLDRQSIMTKISNIFIADLEDKPSSGTEGEINDEITALSLRERPLTPIFIIGNPEKNELANIIQRKIEYIMNAKLYKGNTHLDKFIIFCKNEDELVEKFVEFVSSPNAWYKKHEIPEKFINEGRTKGSKGKDIGWPITERFNY